MRRPAITAVHVERGRGMPRPYTPQIRSPCFVPWARSPAQRRGDACVVLPLQPCMLKEGEACLAPTHLKVHVTYFGPSARSPAQRRGDARVALQPQACMSKQGEACLAPTHLKFVA